jgi:DNA-binding IclR family transcriptional regulator
VTEGPAEPTRVRGRRPPQGDPVVDRAFALLAAFDAGHRSLTLGELSRRSGIPTSSTLRLAGRLMAWGALERGNDGRFTVGLRLWEVASLAPRGLGLREQAMPFLEDLYEVTHENVQLAVREDLEVVFVERIAGRGAVRVLTRVGGRFAMHATGVGLVLLAHAPAEVQEEVLGGPLRSYTEETITDPRRLRRLLAEVRRRGYAVSSRQVTMDAVSIAAPIFGPDRTVVASVSLVLQADAARPRTLAPVVQAAARGISRALGAQLSG